MGTSYEAVGEALSAGTCRRGPDPGRHLCTVRRRMRRAADRHPRRPVHRFRQRQGLERSTPLPKPPTNQVTSYRALMIAGPSEKGKALAAKVNAGEASDLGGCERRKLERYGLLLPRGLYLSVPLAAGELSSKNITELASRRTVRFLRQRLCPPGIRPGRRACVPMLTRRRDYEDKVDQRVCNGQTAFGRIRPSSA